MLRTLSVDASRRLRSWFDEAGYTEVNLLRYLGAAELPSVICVMRPGYSIARAKLRC